MLSSVSVVLRHSPFPLIPLSLHLPSHPSSHTPSDSAVLQCSAPSHLSSGRGTGITCAHGESPHAHLGSVGRDQSIPTSLRCVCTGSSHIVPSHTGTLGQSSIARQSIVHRTAPASYLQSPPLPLRSHTVDFHPSSATLGPPASSRLLIVPHRPRLHCTTGLSSVSVA